MQDTQNETLIKEVPVAFDSTDGKSTIRGRVWLNKHEEDKLGNKVKGLIVIAHGMSEHSQRYADFARALVLAGYVVAAHDHIGHGTSSTPDMWGKLSKDAGYYMIEDLHQMRKVAESFVSKDTPTILFGHSMGSFIVRCYLSQYAKGISAAIICGTGYMPAVKGKPALAMASTICRIKGEMSYSKLLHAASIGAYEKAIKDAKTNCDWLSYNEENVRDYRADGACGFPFTAGGLYAVAKLATDASLPKTVAAYPKDLPLLYISGADDPVGDMGQGVRKSVELAEDAHIKQVSCKLYGGMRHEILLELANDIVYTDILTWLDSVLKEA